MTERSFLINMPDPEVLHGVNDCNITIIKQHFPKLKLVFRGDTVKAIGAPEEIEQFANALDLITKYYDK